MKRTVGWMFGAYCLLAASEWLLDPVSLRARAVLYGLVGLGALVGNRGRAWAVRGELVKLGLASLLLLAVPEVAAAWALGHVSGNLGTVVWGIVPVFLVLVVAQEDGVAMRMLVPAVVGLGGVLLLIPSSLPESTVGRIAAAVLVGSALLIAFSGVWIYRILQKFEWMQAVAVICVANAVVLFVAGLLFGGSGWGLGGNWSGVLLRGAEILLLVGVLRGGTPLQVGARFLLVPLLTIVEGVVLLRPELTVRMGVGAALLAGGTGYLLLAREGDEDGSLSL
ncbi:MAG: hypothetical protein JWM43_1212 [Acidobacteriaceae bacterium]|nr:hypothetical protein [Acidobacteriaceae bacterium]